MTMIPRILGQGIARAAAALLVLVTVAWTGCDPLDVSDPTRLEEPNVANPTGADLMRKNALRRLFVTTASSADLSGALSDEYHVVEQPTISPQGMLDLRLDDADNAGIRLYRDWQQVRYAASLAVQRIETDAPAAVRSAHLGQMRAVRGFAALRMGEDFCPGFPLHELDGYTVVYGQPLQTTEEIFERALEDLDSAVVLAADSAQIIDFVRVTLGRTLLELGRFAEAAAAVEPVPTDYVFIAPFGDTDSGQSNPLSRLTMPGMGPVASVSDGEGGNGVDFVSAADPRLPTTWDDVYERWRPNKYLEWDAPMVLSSGVEARLIEAEAALAAGGSSWLDILNDLRATQISPALEPLEDPGDAAARVDLLFRERAFWLFGTGHRLADLQRLVRAYERPVETVFPTGAHPLGIIYQTATSIMFPWEDEAEFNPAVTGCTG